MANGRNNSRVDAGPLVLVAAMLHLHLDLAVRRIGAEPERLGLRDVWDGKGVATFNVHRPHMLFRAIRQSGAFCGQETQEDGYETTHICYSEYSTGANHSKIGLPYLYGAYR